MYLYEVAWSGVKVGGVWWGVIGLNSMHGVSGWGVICQGVRGDVAVYSEYCKAKT